MDKVSHENKMKLLNEIKDIKTFESAMKMYEKLINLVDKYIGES
jgi:hypothetical protein